MVPRKSRASVDFYTGLLTKVLVDAYQCYPEISSRELLRDKKSLVARVETEGLSFFTKTLPKLGRALDRGLESGELIVPSEFGCKSKSGLRWNIPKLFSALFLTIFDFQGKLRHDKNNAVCFIRQLCFVFYKLELPTSPQHIVSAVEKFKEIELSLPSRHEVVSRLDPLVIRRARWLLGRLFRGFDPSNIKPRHGPGSVACKSVFGRRKYDVFFFSDEINRLYPYMWFSTFGIHSQNLTDSLGHRSLSREVSPARVVLVPKDSRGPRIISCEPALLQYLQQGLARKIYRLVETHYLSRGCVSFTNQLPNRYRALQSSIDGYWATIDLADASDRVSCDLVKMLFPEHLLPYLMALRSETSQLPDGSIVKIQKFAPMGSALCFPIEALSFWALSAAAFWTVSRRRALRPPTVYVYGDDIIVPAKQFERVVAVLEDAGLKVNRDKCFVKGKFRESCGCDAFLGEDVTPVRLRAPWRQVQQQSFDSVYRWSKNAQSFFDKGYWNAAEFLWSQCENRVGLLPTLSPRFPGICRTSTLLPTRSTIPVGSRIRWNKDLQRTEIRTLLVKTRKVLSEFSGGAVRLGCNLIQGLPEPYDDAVAVPHSAKTKAGWAALA